MVHAKWQRMEFGREEREPCHCHATMHPRQWLSRPHGDGDLAIAPTQTTTTTITRVFLSPCYMEYIHANAIAHGNYIVLAEHMAMKSNALFVKQIGFRCSDWKFVAPLPNSWISPQDCFLRSCSGEKSFWGYYGRVFASVLPCS